MYKSSIFLIICKHEQNNNAPANISVIETGKLDTGHPDHQFEKENYLLFLIEETNIPKYFGK